MVLAYAYYVRMYVYVNVIQLSPCDRCTVYWESSVEEKVCEFRKTGSIRECFLALFNLSRNFYI